MPITGKGKALAIGLAVAIVLALLITPLGGQETRGIPTVKLLGFVGVVSLLAGLVLTVVSIALLFRRGRARVASILAIIGSLLFFPVLLTDQTGNFSSLRPPTIITDLELVMFVVVIVVLFLASRVYRESWSGN